MSSPRLLQRFGGGALPLVTATVVTLAGLVLTLMAWRGAFSSNMHTDPVVVYCAAGVMPAVRPVAEQYEAEFGIPIELISGSSGTLEAQIRSLEGVRSGDLYIPAAQDPFIDRNLVGGESSQETGQKPFIKEVIPLARFSLVLAVNPECEEKITSLDDLIGPQREVDFVIANKQAAVGRKTREILESAGRWEEVRAAADQVATVTEATALVDLGVAADAGFIWDANARQQGLHIVDLPELAAEPSLISVGVIASSTNPTGALRFARYLAAPKKSQVSFKRLHYEPVQGDPWEPGIPEVVLFSGGVNRDAIELTIAEFERREGCKVQATFDGCGSLVASMNAGQDPDAYFACDVSFLTMVEDRFQTGVEVTDTDMVMLVRPGNPKGIRSIEDLAREGIAFGIADETKSALGKLSVDLLKSRGIYERAVKNRKLESPTAHFLIPQLTQSDALDAVIVYRANCHYIDSAAEIVPIDDPRASAVQPFAVHQQAKYPQLTERLQKAISSAKSRQRFEEFGFRWQLGGTREQESP